MKRPLFFLGSLLTSIALWGQCTISCGPTPCTLNWQNTPPTCADGGTMIIPVGVTLNFDTNADTWTGSNIEVYGELRINASGQITINSLVTVKSGGLLTIVSKLNLGSSGGCGYTIIVESGGLLDISGGAADRLNICGQEIARGGTAGCNECPEVPPGSGEYDCTSVSPSYCEPPGGFAGPIYFTEDGVLPVELIFFTAQKNNDNVVLKWATAVEENFDHFVVQHAANGLDFSDLAIVPGSGYNTNSRHDYSYTHTLPIIGYNYYRLKAVDIDGSYEYFGPVSERFASARALWVHPNPSTGEQVVYKSNFTPNENDRVQVISPVGQVVVDVPASKNFGAISFPESLKPGSYILRYASSSEVQFARFIVVGR
jgi:hypothetical protein